MQSTFTSTQAIGLLVAEVRAALVDYSRRYPIDLHESYITRAAEYLVAELGRERVEFISSRFAQELVEELQRSIDEPAWRKYQNVMRTLAHQPAERWQLTVAWFDALVRHKQLASRARYVPEAAALRNFAGHLTYRATEVDLELTIKGLLGEHATISERRLSFACDAFLQRMEHRKQVTMHGFVATWRYDRKYSRANAAHCARTSSSRDR